MLEDKIYDILKDIPNVYEGWYRKDIKEAHVTFLIYQQKPENFSSCDNESINDFIQVDVWGTDKDEVRNVENQVKILLKENEFMWIEGNRDFETDTLIQHNSLRFSYLEDADN